MRDVNQDGSASRRLFAVGPLTRAAFWEIIAIPDIRNQCVEPAERMVQNAAKAAEPSFTTASPASVPLHAPIDRARVIGHH